MTDAFARLIAEASVLEGLAADLHRLAFRLRRPPSKDAPGQATPSSREAEQLAQRLERQAVALREIAAEIAQARRAPQASTG